MKQENRKHEFEIFADFFQIYVEDSAVNDSYLAGLKWSDANVQDRLLAKGDVLIISTVRNMNVPFSVKILGEEPKLNVSEWDHIVQSSINVPSGTLNISGTTDYVDDIRKINVKPGAYNAYVCFSGLRTLSEDGLSGNDRYELLLWPSSEELALKVLKQFN